MKKGLVALALAASVVPVSAQAALNYNYAEVGIALYPWADADQTWFGVDARGSFVITPEVFGFGGLKYLTDDLDYTALHVGAGYKVAIDQRMDVWGGVSLEYQEVDVNVPRRCFEGGICVGGSSSANDTSMALRGGMRMAVNQRLEVAGSARYVLGDFDYLGLTGTVRYDLKENLVLLGEVDIFDGDLGMLGGLTFFF